MAEQEDLILLERVFLRIGTADSDDKLQTNLKFLVPVLKKLASNAASVRKKVLELLTLVNKKLKAKPAMQLPVPAILTLYGEPGTSPAVLGVTILYVKMGYTRLSTEEQGKHLPQLMACLEGKPAAQQLSILQLMMPALPYLNLPAVKEERIKLFQPVTSNQAVQKLIIDHMSDVLITPYDYRMYVETAATPTPSPASAPAQAPAPPPAPAEPSTSDTTPPGEITESKEEKTPDEKPSGPPPAMSQTSLKHVLGETPPDPDLLEKIKLAIIRIMGGDVFPANDVICALTLASTDIRKASVGLDADTRMRDCACDLENRKLVLRLYAAYQGTLPVKGKPVKPETKVSPASLEMKKALLPLLLRSAEAVKVPTCIQVVFDCLNHADSDVTLQDAGISLARHMCSRSPDALFRAVGGVLITGMVKFIGDAKEHLKLRGAGYEAIGDIARRHPTLVTKDITILQTLFNNMAIEEGENKQIIKLCLSGMIDTFKILLPPNSQRSLEELLMENVEKNHSMNRMAAVQYANALFKPDHVPSRYVLLMACGDLKDEIYTEACRGLQTLTAVTDKKSKDKFPEAPEPLPTFKDMAAYLHDRETERLNTSKKYVTGNNVIAFNPVTFGKIMMYLRILLTRDAGLTPDMTSLESMKSQIPRMAEFVQKLAKDEDKHGPVSVYADFTRQLVSSFPGVPPMYCFLEIVAIARRKFAPIYVQDLYIIKNFMFSRCFEMRVCSAEMYGLTAAYGSQRRYGEILQEMNANLESRSPDCRHGAALGLGYFLAYLALAERTKPPEEVKVEPDKPEEVKVELDKPEEKENAEKGDTADVDMEETPADSEKSAATDSADAVTSDAGEETKADDSEKSAGKDSADVADDKDINVEMVEEEAPQNKTTDDSNTTASSTTTDVTSSTGNKDDSRTLPSSIADVTSSTGDKDGSSILASSTAADAVSSTGDKDGSSTLASSTADAESSTGDKDGSSMYVEDGQQPGTSSGSGQGGARPKPSNPMFGAEDPFSEGGGMFEDPSLFGKNSSLFGGKGDKEEEGEKKEELPKKEEEPPIDVEEERIKAVEKLVTFLEDKEEIMVQGACDALGEMGRQGAFNLPDTSEEEAVVTRETIITTIISKLSSQDKKTRMRAAVCLGHMCVGEAEFPYNKQITDALLSKSCTAELEPEILTVYGETLLMAAEGQVSPEARDFWLQTEDMYQAPENADTGAVGELMNRLLELPESQPHAKLAASTWLTILSRASGRHPIIQDNKQKITEAVTALSC